MLYNVDVGEAFVVWGGAGGAGGDGEDGDDEGFGEGLGDMLCGV